MEETKTAGRPKIYSQEILDKTVQYIENCKDVEEDKENGIAKQVNLPSIEGLAYEIKVNRDTIYAWCKEYPEFSDIIDDLRAKQAKYLLNKGLSGDYNSTIAKVILTKHGYIDKQDVTSDGKAIKGNSIIFSNFKENE